MRRVRKVAAKPPPEEEEEGEGPEDRPGPWTPLRRGEVEDDDGRYRFVKVPPIEGEATGGQGAVELAVQECVAWLETNGFHGEGSGHEKPQDRTAARTARRCAQR